jgi:hypothetical protein
VLLPDTNERIPPLASCSIASICLAGKRRAFCGSLHFDEAALAGHHDVHIRIAAESST